MLKNVSKTRLQVDSYSVRLPALQNLFTYLLLASVYLSLLAHRWRTSSSSLETSSSITSILKRRGLRFVFCLLHKNAEIVISEKVFFI